MIGKKQVLVQDFVTFADCMQMISLWFDFPVGKGNSDCS